MASTFTTHLNLEQPGFNEQAGTWGTTINNNLDLIDDESQARSKMNGSGVVVTGTRRITEPAAGEIIVSEWDGSAWVTLFDSRNKAAASGAFLPLTGGTLTGNLTMSGSTKVVLNSDGTASTHAVRKSQAEDIADAAQAAAEATAEAAMNLAAPIGSIVAWPDNAAPTNWRQCGGAAISRTTFATLFSLIGTTFGAGDGSTTFNLPDLRGEFIRGWDNGRGIDSARVFGSSQTDQLEAHVHTYQTGGVLGGGFPSLDNGGGLFVNTTSTGGAETRPRNVALMYIIRVL